jgi:hypothetical protein
MASVRYDISSDPKVKPFIAIGYKPSEAEDRERNSERIWNEYRFNRRRFALNRDLMSLSRMMRNGETDDACKLCDQLLFVIFIKSDGTSSFEKKENEYDGKYWKFADVCGTIKYTMTYKLGINELTGLPFDDSDSSNALGGLNFTTIDVCRDYISNGNLMAFITIDLRNTQCIFHSKESRGHADKVNVVHFHRLNTIRAGEQLGLFNIALNTFDDFVPSLDDHYYYFLTTKTILPHETPRFEFLLKQEYDLQSMKSLMAMLTAPMGYLKVLARTYSQKSPYFADLFYGK